MIRFQEYPFKCRILLSPFLLWVACGLGYSQNYFPFEAISDGAPLVIPAPDDVALFSNSPWPAQSGRSVSVRVSEAVVVKFLREGKSMKADEDQWLEASKAPVTIPEAIARKFPGLFTSERLSDPTAYVFDCRGVFVTKDDEFFFWYMLNDRNLYLTNGEAACIVRVVDPIPPDSIGVNHSSSGPQKLDRSPRVVRKLVEEPFFVRLSTWSEDIDLCTVDEILRQGQYFSLPTVARDQDRETTNLPLVTILEIVDREQVPERVRLILDDIHCKFEKMSEWDLPRGVALLGEDCLIFWRWLGHGILELRPANEEIGLMLFLTDQ